ncbi:hypothetical protein A8C32_01820 [Flavivirga aquatica]|uniref:Uncharacterized protein n=1 Tax=Flavivirga aquatica TaxID=1849968 RepID=A0A1E5TA67_9FLAO|nr:hypothetical protein [Flavivirga aquatica]OEK08226.1 hypothetical protein A8C32_01820 [Flavivirga aquatica]
MNNNRFLFLEEDLKVFSEQPSKLIHKKKYSTQKTPAAGVALAGAVIAGTGVGWQIFEFAWAHTEGDIKVKLARMEGAKLPGDDKSFQNKGTWKKKTVRIYEKDGSRIGDEISAKFDLSFKYNGYGVGYIDMDHVESNDAVAFGLNVEAKLMADPNTYISNNGGQDMAMVEVTFNYRFTHSFQNDLIKVKRLKLYGDGTVI